MTQAAQKMADTFGQLDPGAECWQFIQKHRPDLWRDHTQAVRANDISQAAATFKAMLAAWQQQPVQGGLF